MPIYEYKCENGHVFDVMQKLSEDPLTTCVECGALVRKVLHPVSISFKGSGFYSTDYKGMTTKETAGKDAQATTNGDKKDKKDKEKPGPPRRPHQARPPRHRSRHHPPLRSLRPHRLLCLRRLHRLAPRLLPRPLRLTLRRPQRPDRSELVSVEG
jgi:putative FmdB family regulatory protein